MGDPDKADLQAELERTGWRVERRADDAWWIHEIWRLTSTWRPVGATAFVILLIDPQAEPEERDVSSVWAAAVAPYRPIDRLRAENSAIRVRPRWPERLKEIVEAVTALRPSPNADH